MLLAVIVELADTHLRHLVLPGVGPHPFGVDLVLLGNLLGGIVFRDVEVILGHNALVWLGFHHQLDVRPADERLLPAQAGGPQFGLLDQLINVLPGDAHQLCGLGE